MILAVDTETTGTDVFHGCRPFLITACDGSYNYIYRGYVNHYNREVTWEDEDIRSFTNLCKRADQIVMHNSNFDIRMLDAIGVNTDYIKYKLEDTLVASHVISSGDVHGLKDLAIKYLDLWDDDEKELERAVKSALREARRLGYDVARHGHPHFPAIKKSGTSFWKMDYWLAPEACEKYAILDVERTLRLWSVFKAEIFKTNLWQQYRTRMELLPIAYDMQTVGKSCYREEMDSLVGQLTADVERHSKKIKQLSGINYRFNPDKKAHLIDLIHTRCGVPVEYYTDSQQPAMDKAALKVYLDKYKTPVIRELNYLKRKQKKIKDIIALGLWCDTDYRIHSNLNITGTRETRQSSSSPNDQNFEKSLKYLLGPEPGKVWICTDMVNIELRIWAYAVGSKELIEAFESGKSVHKIIMSVIFPEEYRIYQQIPNPDDPLLPPELVAVVKTYGRVKNGNFARIYGATDKKTNETYHGGKNAPNYCALIDARFPEIKQFMNYCKVMCSVTFKKHGVYGIQCIGGYRLDVPCDEPYKATNYYVQGTAGWIMGQAMIDWSKHRTYRAYDCAMISQVHDGLDTEVSIVPNLREIIETKIQVLSDAGKKYIPTCGITWKLRYHPLDETNPTIQEILLST